MSDVEMLTAILDSERLKKAADPVHWFQLTAPDGSTRGDILECHQSECERLNAARMAGYLHSEKQRQEKRKAWEAKRDSEGRMSVILQAEREAVAVRTQAAIVPIPEQSSALVRELVANRKTHPAPVAVAVPALEPEPVIEYGPEDYLWTRVHDVRGHVIRAEGTRRGRHD